MAAQNLVNGLTGQRLGALRQPRSSTHPASPLILGTLTGCRKRLLLTEYLHDGLEMSFSRPPHLALPIPFCAFCLEFLLDLRIGF